ncbi:MAG: hypothetical protein A2017_10015 [Lentisphaerae bacterium GWF2_44_16]|nr:MAG: hypothetical protein A2017_10015 [Lentisphaerae bacterium GWF2_44_16]
MSGKNSYEGIDPEIVKQVHWAAMKAIGKSGFTKSDLPDIEQELMIAALEGQKYLRESVKNEKAFISGIINNRIKTIFRERNRKSRNWHKCCLSLNIPVELDDGDIEELINLIDNDHLLRCNSYYWPDPYWDIDLALNINAVIRELPKSLQRFCEELKNKSIKELMKEKNITRKCIYRKIIRLKKNLKLQESFFPVSI